MSLNTQISPSGSRDARERLARKRVSWERLPQFAVLGGILAEIIIFAIISPAFFTVNNLVSVVNQTSIIGIIALAQAMLIIAGGIDVSVGSIVGVTGMIFALLLIAGVPVPAAIAVGLGAGLVSGLLNGMLIGSLRIDPFITTLATLGVYRGVTYILSDQRQVSTAGAQDVSWIARGALLSVPLPVWIFAAVAVVFIVLERRTTIGRRVYSVGLSPRAARQSGIEPARVHLGLYAATGFCAAVSGIIIVAQIGVATPSQGAGFELDVIAAVVVGGIALSGGRGSVAQALLGSLFLGILINGFAINNVPDVWQKVANGLAILLAVGIAVRRKKD